MIDFEFWTEENKNLFKQKQKIKLYDSIIVAKKNNPNWNSKIRDIVDMANQTPNFASLYSDEDLNHVALNFDIAHFASLSDDDSLLLKRTNSKFYDRRGGAIISIAANGYDLFYNYKPWVVAMLKIKEDSWIYGLVKSDIEKIKKNIDLFEIDE